MKKLRQKREMLGWTQHDLARAAGIAPGRISFWETERTELSDAELERVKTALARRAKEVAATVLA